MQTLLLALLLASVSDAASPDEKSPLSPSLSVESLTSTITTLSESTSEAATPNKSPKVLEYKRGKNPSVVMKFIPISEASATTRHLVLIYENMVDCVVLEDAQSPKGIPDELFDQFHYLHVCCWYDDDRYIVHWYQTAEPPVTWLVSSLKAYLFYPLLSSLSRREFKNRQIYDVLERTIKKVAGKIAELSTDATLDCCIEYFASNSKLLQRVLAKSNEGENPDSDGIQEMPFKLSPNLISQTLQNLNRRQCEKFNSEIGDLVANLLLQIRYLHDYIDYILSRILPRIPDDNMEVKKAARRQRRWPWNPSYLCCTEENQIFEGRPMKRQEIDEADNMQIVEALMQTLQASSWRRICMSYFNYRDAIISKIPQDLQTGNPSRMILLVSE